MWNGTTTAEVGSIELEILPGGAWAWPQLPSMSNDWITLQKTAGLGDDAYSGCQAHVADFRQECVTHILTRDTWVAVSVITSNSSLAASLVQKIYTALDFAS